MTARDVAESSLGIVASHQGDHSSSPLGSILFQLPNEEIHRNRIKYVISGGHTSCHGDICSRFHNARRLQQFGPHEGVTTLLQSVSWGCTQLFHYGTGTNSIIFEIAVAVLGNGHALDQRFGRGSNCLIFHHIFSLSKALVNLFLG
ncbi:hypothetical protein ACFX2A_025956 [Malus domestica]